MTMGKLRLRTRRTAAVLAAGVTLLLLAEAASAAAGETVDRGVVQAISSTAITLRALDESQVVIALDAGTELLLNGRPATIDSVFPGFVASAFHEGTSPARLVRIVATARLRTDEGSVVSIARRVLTLRREDGSTVQARVGLRTRVRRPNGQPARRAAVRPGRLVRVTHVPGKVALLIVVLRAGP
jgi:hypothetical protein